MQARATRDILLQVPNLEQATAFYRDTLGMRVFLSTPTLVGIDAGSFNLFLDKSTPLGPVLEFLVDDVQEARRELLDQGCILIAEDPGIPRLYLRDPYGLIFNIAANLNAEEADPEPIRGPEPPPHY